VAQSQIDWLAAQQALHNTRVGGRKQHHMA
jgi:hypothetical protein